MKTLDQIAIEHGTDKATSHPVKGHGYAPLYERFFEPLRNSPIKLLEIGVGGGESINTWIEYFDRGRIYGVDMVSGTNPWNRPELNRDLCAYTFVNGDQSSEVFWKCFIADYGRDWDIIIDDGGHFNDQVITSFNSLWPFVRPNGLYCIEDLGVAYGAGSIFVRSGWPNHIDLIRKQIDAANQGDGVSEVHCFRELAIIRKAE